MTEQQRKLRALITIPLDRCIEILAMTDWGSSDRYTPVEKAAIATVLTHYMLGDISRQRAAAILHQDPIDLPAPW